jgi:acyl-CoA thioesterase-2
MPPSSRGLNRGLVYAQDGRLVASTAQEGLMRLREVPEKVLNPCCW